MMYISILTLTKKKPNFNRIESKRNCLVNSFNQLDESIALTHYLFMIINPNIQSTG